MRLTDDLADAAQPNILVDRLGRARIMDFALTTVDRDQGPAGDVTEMRNIPTRWTAPEVENGPFTKKSDVFSFAMVMVEVSCGACLKGPPANRIVISIKVFTGKVPFDSILSATSAAKIMQGERPPQPTDLTLPDVWALMEMCWDHDPRLRPEMRRVLQDLASSLLRSLRQSIASSSEFQVVLGQFYDSTERKGCIDRLRDAELKEFVNFLDDVRGRSTLSDPNTSGDFWIGVTYQGTQ